MTSLRLAALAMAGLAPLAAQTTATIDINPTVSTALNANFSGFNDEMVFPAEFYDYRLENMAAKLSPSWVRFPSGAFSDAYNWQTGNMVPAWAAQFQGTSIATLLAQSVPWVNGKGGAAFTDAANRADLLGAKLIVCVNGFTDTPASAGAMAAFAKANHIPVAIWELSNEPYLFKGFFSDADDYANKMKPYRDAIKAADPNAVVAIFFMDAGDTSGSGWNAALGAYPNKYWDAVTYHQYPAQSTGPFNQWMADANGVLATRTTSYVTQTLAPFNPPGMKYLISEFLPTNDGTGTGSSIIDGTLYGAIYAAEFTMRMSTLPQMLYVGMHALTGTRGVYATDAHYTDVTAAYNAGTTIDTLSLNFGYYFAAQPLGLAVLNGVLKNANQVVSTTVTGGAMVAATGPGQIPALYAQAYSTPNGAASVVITNKSATPHVVTIRLGGASVAGVLNVQSISGTDPTVQNTSSAQNAVVVQSSTSPNPVTIPPYSVVRVDLIAQTSLVALNNASYAQAPVAAQEFVTLFGQGLAGQTAVAASVPYPTTLGGVSVQVTDSKGASQLAPLYLVSPSQLNILIPTGLAPGPAQVTVLAGPTKIPLGSGATGSVSIAGSSPGLYSMNSDGAGVAAAVALRATASNQVVNEPVFTCDTSIARSCLGAPLSLGASTDTLYVELYGTGIRGAASVQCYVAGQSVPVQYAGAVTAYPGLDQVNVTIPRGLAGTGTALVYLVADGVASNVVSLNVQ